MQEKRGETVTKNNDIFTSSQQERAVRKCSDMGTLKDMQTLRCDFLVYLETELGRSQKTVENYDRYLSSFFTTAHIRKPADITPGCVERFLASKERCAVRTRGGVHAHSAIHEKTKNYHRIAIRMFLKYLQAHGVTALASNRIELSPTVSSKTAHLDEGEVKLLQALPTKTDSMSLRDRAIVLTLLSTGVRVSELCALNMEDVDLGAESCVVSGSGEKARTVYLSTHARHAIEEYLHVRKNQGSALFLNNGARVNEEGETRLTPRSVQRIVRQYALSAGISKSVTPHTLRHTLALHTLRDGADSSSMQTLMGYGSASVARAYTRSVVQRNTKKQQGGK